MQNTTRGHPYLMYPKLVIASDQKGVIHKTCKCCSFNMKLNLISRFTISIFYSVMLQNKNMIFLLKTKVTHSLLPVCVCYPSVFHSLSVPATCRSLLYWQVVCLCSVLAVSVTNYLSLCLSFLCCLSVGSAD